MPCARHRWRSGEILHKGERTYISLGMDIKPSVCIFMVCQVEASQLESFHATYGALLKSSMTTLRKRDKKREKQRAEESARRKRRLAEDIAVQGPKRGNGRRKRQRLLKAALKQNEARKRAQEKETARFNKAATT